MFIPGQTVHRKAMERTDRPVSSKNVTCQKRIEVDVKVRKWGFDDGANVKRVHSILRVVQPMYTCTKDCCMITCSYSLLSNFSV